MFCPRLFLSSIHNRSAYILHTQYTPRIHYHFSEREWACHDMLGYCWLLGVAHTRCCSVCYVFDCVIELHSLHVINYECESFYTLWSKLSPRLSLSLSFFPPFRVLSCVSNLNTFFSRSIRSISSECALPSLSRVFFIRFLFVLSFERVKKKANFAFVVVVFLPLSIFFFVVIECD